jgi:hypothetical protein
MYVLSLAPHDLRVRRSDPAHLLLEMTDLPRRSNDFETLFNDEPFEVGDEASFGEFDAAVQSVQRGLPTRVRFRMPGQSCLLLLDGGQLVSVRPPAPGKQLNVRYEPGPLGL